MAPLQSSPSTLANLQVRGGQFMTDFGRINSQHPHSWSFVDVPLVNARFLGSDGLRNPGARLSWLAPTAFYSEMFLAVQNSQGETASGFRSSGGHAHGDAEEEVPFGYRHSDNDRGVDGVGDAATGWPSLAPPQAWRKKRTENVIHARMQGTSRLLTPATHGTGIGLHDEIENVSDS